MAFRPSSPPSPSSHETIPRLAPPWPNSSAPRTRGGGLGWWWHTTEDTLDKIDADNLVRDARVYAETLWRLCTLPRLPFDYAAAADEIAQTLDRYHEAAAGHLDLQRTKALALELARELRGGALDHLDPGRANAVLIELGHLLIPVNYTRTRTVRAGPRARHSTAAGPGRCSHAWTPG